MIRTTAGRIFSQLQCDRRIARHMQTYRSMSSMSSTCCTFQRKNSLSLASAPRTNGDRYLLAPDVQLNQIKLQYNISRAHNSGNNTTTTTTTTERTTNLSAKNRVENLLKSSKKSVFVFMKGVPSQPACGYSNAVVQILNAYGVEYDSFDVLSDDVIRQEVKAYSNWPTIPQVYVGGSFVGGCDILIQMHQSNELESLLNVKSSANDSTATDVDSTGGADEQTKK